MDKECRDFREMLLRYWEEHETVHPIVSEDPHPGTCPNCRRHIREFQAYMEQLAASRKIEGSEPDFHRLRAGVWRRIGERQNRPRAFRVFLRPAVFAPVFAAIVAFFVWWAVSHNPSQKTPIDMNDLLYSAAVQELKPDYYPDEAIHSVVNAEMSYSIYNYFISRKDYSTIQDISATAGEWDQIAQSMADQNM